MSSGKTFSAFLADDVDVIAEPPTAPFAYPTGQPLALVTVEQTLRAGPTLLLATFAFSLWNTGETIADENQPYADLFLFLDDVQIPKLGADFVDYSIGFASEPPLSVVGRSGALSRVVVVSPGLHKVELKVGVSGVGPHAMARFVVSGGTNHATLVVQEVQS